MIPSHRIEKLNERTPNPSGEFILYWMISSRRTRDNYALDYAISIAEEQQKPLVVFEPLRLGYQHASERFHQFIIEGMQENQKRFADSNIHYYPYVEEREGDGKGLLHSLTERSYCVITDYYPCFFLPSMVKAAAANCPVKMYGVDSNGILPLFKTERFFTTAASFRRHLQKTIIPALSEFPQEDPLHRENLPRLEVSFSSKKQWKKANIDKLLSPNGLSHLNIDHDVGAVSISGGEVSAFEALQSFLDSKLCRYHEDRNQIESNACSGLSPYLHFGHISAHTIVREIFRRENYVIPTEAPKATGSRAGWWGLSAFSEAFLDQIITWRELGFVFNHHHISTYDQYISLPEWALKTLDHHRNDPREYLYSLDELDRGKTHDPIWNAAQNQLRQDGIIHNYLRMLWAKKVLEWTESPEQALSFLVELNNKYAIDGRDPNSYSGIFWTLGRFDRAWGPERPIFGKIRYMSSASTSRKIKLAGYLKRYC